MILFGLAAQVSFTFFLLFAFLLFWFKQPAPPSKALRKLYVCVFVEKRKITRKCLFRFFFSYFMRICLSFPCLALLGCFLFLSRFGWSMSIVLFLPTALFCALDGCSWRFLHLLDNSLFLFRIIKRVSATMMETFEKPTASFFFLSVSSIRRVAETTWLSCLTFDLFPRANRKCESAEWNWRGRSWLVFFKFY